MNNWRTLLKIELENNGETFSDIVFNTMSEDEMHKMFDDGYGVFEGIPFTVWTKGYVYFPEGYDGAETVKSVPRNPNGKKTSHIGGGG